MTTTPSPARSDGGHSGLAAVWERYGGRIGVGAALAVMALTAVALRHLLTEIRYDDLLAVLVATAWTKVALALLFTAASFAALTVYDRQALALVGWRPPYALVALASFCAYAVGNVAGFGPLTGGTIRYRFYSPLGLTPDAIGRAIAYITIAFGVGLAFVTAVGMLWADASVARLAGLSPLAVRLAAAAMLAAVASLVAASALGLRTVTVFGRSVALPSPGQQLVQLAATSADVAAAAAVLWVLLPAGAPDLPAFLSIYAVAIGLGVLSHVPGGIGVFETVVIGALGGSVPLEGVVGALVLYRVIYYVVPLALAVVAVTASELGRVASDNPVVRRASGAMLPLVLGALAVLLGAMLVFSGVTPATSARLDLLQQLFPLPVVEGAHFLASVIGVFMIVAARGLVHRLDGAWVAALTLSGLSIPLALVKGLAVGEATLLAVMVIALLATRRVFNRPASLIHDRLSPGWWLCVGTVLVAGAAILLFVYKEVDYSHELWWQFEFSATAPRSLRAALGIVLAAGSLGAFLLTRPPAGHTDRPTGEEIARAVAIVEAQAFPDANLVRMGDKSLMFSDDGSAFVMYGKRGRSWVALFDPVGQPAAWPELVWRFVETARTHGGRAVFYQVAPENLSLYADAGLSAFKLGEEARIDLARFDLKGSRRGNFRNAINKLERDGVVFEVLAPCAVAGAIDDLRRVSDGWLALHEVREKGFSLGAFDPAYVSAQPVALLRRNGRAIAFATLSVTGIRDEATVDLMRFEPDAPNGAMEMLFAKTLLHLKGEGYAWFSLGMAPLAGLSENPVAPLWHRIGRAVYDHGEAFYNFHGLRAFKAKFDPEWRPRYMAVAGGLNPLIALADVTVLISGSLKGAITK